MRSPPCQTEIGRMALSSIAVRALILLWIILRVEHHARLVQIVAFTTLGGGFLPSLSIAQYGLPPSRALAASP